MGETRAWGVSSSLTSESNQLRMQRLSRPRAFLLRDGLTITLVFPMMARFSSRITLDTTNVFHVLLKIRNSGARTRSAEEVRAMLTHTLSRFWELSKLGHVRCFDGFWVTLFDKRYEPFCIDARLCDDYQRCIIDRRHAKFSKTTAQCQKACPLPLRCKTKQTRSYVLPSCRIECKFFTYGWGSPDTAPFQLHTRSHGRVFEAKLNLQCRYQYSQLDIDGEISLDDIHLLPSTRTANPAADTTQNVIKVVHRQTSQHTLEWYRYSRQKYRKVYC